jgi:RNA-directed DNA polymerase
MNSSDKLHSDTFISIFSPKNIEVVYGKNIALSSSKGIDRITPFQFDRRKIGNISLINKKCSSCEYEFSPFLEKLILRGKERPPRVISIATVRDRIVLSLLKDYLHEIFPDCVNRKLPNSYINDLKSFYDSNTQNDLYMLKVDIETFYDKIRHKKLEDILSERISSKADLLLVKRAIRTLTVPLEHKREQLKTKNKRGVPQGLAISNILANIYLHSFDETLRTKCVMYLRYVDDILMIVKKAEKESLQIIVNDQLRNLGLKTNKKPGKTVCVPLNDSIEYLGYLIQLPSVSVKKTTFERFLRSVSNFFSIYSHIGPKGMYPDVPENFGEKLFVSDLNEKITGAVSENRRYGWLSYFLEMNDLPLLYKMDLIIREKFYPRIKKGRFRPSLAELKKLSRSYYEAKFNPFGGYIHNYNQYDTLPKKREYLKSRGVLDERKTYKPIEIERLFSQIMKQHLAKLESDVGETS